MLRVRHSSYVSPVTIMSSIYTSIMIPSNLKKAIGNFMSFVNFLGPEDNPFGSTTNFKSLDPEQYLKECACLEDSLALKLFVEISGHSSIQLH